MCIGSFEALVWGRPNRRFLNKTLIAGSHPGAAPAPGAKRPPGASGCFALQNRRFLNKALIAGDHYGAAPAPGAKRPSRASGGLGFQNRRFLNKALIAGDHFGAAPAPGAKRPGLYTKSESPRKSVVQPLEILLLPAYSKRSVKKNGAVYEIGIDSVSDSVPYSVSGVMCPADV